MKKLSIKILLFLAVCIMIDFSIGTILEKNGKKRFRDRRLELVLEDKLATDLICIGSSRAAFNIRPLVLNENLNISSFNLGFTGSNINFHKDIINLTTRLSTRPKYILLVIDEPVYFKDFEGYVYQEEKLEPFVYDDQINGFLCDRSEKKEWVTYISKCYRQNVNFFNTLNYFIRGVEELNSTNNFDSLGGIHYTPDHPPILKWNKFLPKIYNSSNESQQKIESYKEILSICKSSNYTLICVLPPIFRDISEGFKQRIEDLTDLENSYILDYRNELHDQVFFQDPDHLNELGASKLSRMICRDMAEKIPAIDLLK